LRERMEDLPELLAHFAQELGKDRTVRFSDEAMRAMSRYDWPGNIREVANAVEYAIVLGDSTEVQLSDLPLAIQDDDRIRSEASAVPAATAEAGTLEEIEMRCILQAMARTAFNRTRAAQLLGITRRTLGYRIAKYGLEDDLEAMRRGELAPPGSDGDGPLPESPNL
ncbi:MAG: hypothetical protein MJE66_16840, partial [Proteobacteria bacterium]|nr:hypothetical protein [Pseudomonadota bacterium]